MESEMPLQSQQSLDTAPTLKLDGEMTNSIHGDATNGVPEMERNGDASQKPRLASLTGLIMNQKSHKLNSTSSDTSTTPRTASTVDPDPTPPSLTRAVRFEDETPELRRTGSFGSSVSSTMSAAHRRTVNTPSNGFGSTVDDRKSTANLTESDLRRFVFHHPRAKRLVSGLRVHAFTRQAFISSFTVGLAIGSLVAIVLKIFKDVACRMLYS